MFHYVLAVGRLKVLHPNKWNLTFLQRSWIELAHALIILYHGKGCVVPYFASTSSSVLGNLLCGSCKDPFALRPVGAYAFYLKCSCVKIIGVLIWSGCSPEVSEGHVLYSPLRKLLIWILTLCDSVGEWNGCADSGKAMYHVSSVVSSE